MDQNMTKDSNLTVSIFLNNQSSMTRPTLIDFNPDEYNQGLRYYPFMVNLDRCNGTCNGLDDLSDKICVQYKTEDLDLTAFDMATRIKK